MPTIGNCWAANTWTTDAWAADTWVSDAPPPDDPHLVLAPATLEFAAIEGGASPDPQDVAISNSGGGSITPALGNIVENEGSGWLDGDVVGTTLTVTIDSSALTAGTYTGTVGVTSVGADNTPQTVGITLEVAAYSPATGGGGSGGPGPATRVIFVASRMRRGGR